MPDISEFHRHQIVGKIARRQLAAPLDEGGGFMGAVDGDDKILARLAFSLGGWPLADTTEPVRHGEDLQFAFLQRAQVGRRMEDRAELVGIAFVERVEIVLHYAFNVGTVLIHFFLLAYY